MEKMKYIKSPIKYVGSKEKYLNQIIPLFPKDRETFIDLFTGSGVVAANVVDKYKKVIATDNNKYIIGLLNEMKSSPGVFMDRVVYIIKKYGFSFTYKYGADKYKEITGTTNPDRYLFLFNKEPFYRLRDYFNLIIGYTPDRALDMELIAMYFVLLTYGFTGGVRFNKRGLCNHTPGRCDLNSSIMKKYEEFAKKIYCPTLTFHSFGFERAVSVARMDATNTFIYADPPYLQTNAQINKTWNEEHLKLLLASLYEYHLQGGKFALSELISYGEEDNTILKEWIETYGFNIHKIKTNYKNCSHNKKDKTKGAVEVLVTNY